MSDWETVNISRIINGKNMKFSEDLTNRNLLQVTKFRDNAEVVIEALKKLMKLPLNGFQTIR